MGRRSGSEEDADADHATTTRDHQRDDRRGGDEEDLDQQLVEATDRRPHDRGGRPEADDERRERPSSLPESLEGHRTCGEADRDRRDRAQDHGVREGVRADHVAERRSEHRHARPLRDSPGGDSREDAQPVRGDRPRPPDVVRRVVRAPGLLPSRVGEQEHDGHERDRERGEQQRDDRTPILRCIGVRRSHADVASRARGARPAPDPPRQASGSDRNRCGRHRPCRTVRGGP